MKKVVIATHGRLADGFMSSLGLLGVDLSHVTALGYYDEKGADISAVDALFDQLAEGDQLVVCSDVSFGSVSQAFARAAAAHPACDCHLVSGVNLPLLLDLCLSPEPVDSERLAQTVAQAQEQLSIVQPPAAPEAPAAGGGDFF